MAQVSSWNIVLEYQVLQKWFNWKDRGTDRGFFMNFCDDIIHTTGDTVGMLLQLDRNFSMLILDVN